MGQFFSDVVEQAIADIYYCYDNDKAKQAAEAVFQAAKNDGDPDAYYILSRCFSGTCYSWDFHPFSENKAAAYAMLNEAVTRGSAIGVLGALRMDMLTPALQEAMPFESIHAAWESVKEKADGGNLFCQYMLGNTYYFLDLLEIDNVSEKDFPDSKAWTGWQREQVEKCLPYFENAFRGGMGLAGRNLVNYYCFGRGSLIPPEKKTGVEWKRIGADLGYPEWQYKYAVDLFYDNGSLKEQEDACQYARKAAEAGHLYAWEVLGDALYEGEIVPKDMKKALDCFEKAGDGENSAYAKSRAGWIYFQGLDGVPQDYARAVQLMTEAYKLSDGRYGVETLGVCYLLGLGCEQNPALGKKLLEEAKPCACRSYGLGMMYAEGIGVKQNIAMGVDWLKKAGEYPPAKEALTHYKKSFFGVWRKV